MKEEVCWLVSGEQKGHGRVNL